MSLRVLRVALFVAVFLQAFQALAAAPLATTSPATSITTSSAVLNGAGTPNGQTTTGWFRISSTNPGTCDDTFGTRVPSTGGTDLGAGAVSVAYSITATGLSSNTTYYFCAIVSNGSGKAYGSILSFLVPAVPTVTTLVPPAVGSTTATLEGTASPGSASTTGWFRYASTNPGSCNDTFGTRAPTSGGSNLGSGTVPVDYTFAITGLTPGTTYYFCAIASNAYGTSYGAVLSFTTQPLAPSVSTNGATLVTGSTAQLNGSANPGGDVTTGWFRYSTTNPGTCNDTFGTRAPATGGTLLGSGNSYVAYSLGVSGLSGATTYYFCAVAQNSVGTSVGTVQSFTTPSAPTAVTTYAATSVTNSTATLNGQANPSGAPTTGYFRYGLTNPGTCNDTFGSRAPTTGGSALGSSTSNIPYAQSISGLSAGTTYYFCAVANNSEGTSFGTVMSFITATTPTVITVAASAISATAATMNGSADPNGDTTYGYFRYATSDPGSCNDSFGTRVQYYSYNDPSLGSGTTPVTFTQALTGLTPSTTYWFCAIGRNNYGTVFGAVLSFTTLAALPTVSTNGASLLTGTTAQLNGSSNPGGAATTGWFRYATASPGTCNDSFGTRAPASGGSAIGSGNTTASFLQGLTGLTAGTTYYYCAIAQNSVGYAYGSVASFVTPTPPLASTAAATGMTSTGARLNGTGTPNGSAATGYFRYSTTSPGTCNDTFGSRAPATGGSSLGTGYSAQGYYQDISGLTSSVTYYYCAIVTSAEGTAFGPVMSFTTTGGPSVTTNPATLVTATTATMNGSAIPNGDTTYGYFRYSTVDPGTCNDSFGTRVQYYSYNDPSLGAGAASVPFSQALTGLLPGTTYYFCALARNGYGTATGNVLSFTTVANPPSVTTNSASLLTGTTAQLNSSVNPGGAATTGWFRYATTSPGSCNDTFGTRAPTSGGASAGSGNAWSSLNQAITGLTPGTTYYYCAVASNSKGTSFGAVVAFTTPTPPTATTTAATSVGNTSATLNGTGTPNGAATTGYFRYSATNPGICDDAFGSRAPVSGGSNLGSGSTAQGFSQTISGLTSGVTYYFCAIADSAEGTGFGTVLSFTTAAVPTVATTAATLVTATSATMNGSADPNGDTTYGYFRYSTVDPGTCNDSFGTRVQYYSYNDPSLGAGSTSIPFSQALTGLTPSTTYYFCALARNNYGTVFGAVLSFTTPATLPTANTNSASLLTGTTAQLNGSSNPGGAATTGWFRFATVSPGTCNDTFGTRAPASGGSAVGSGNTTASYLQAISGLTAGTTYYFCALAQNSKGLAVGSVVSFVTPTPPLVTTTAANYVTNVGARLNGTGTPNGSATTGYFRYSTTNPGTCDDAFGSRAPATGGSALGSSYGAQGFYQDISSLTSGVTYYYCAIVFSAEGTAYGSVMSFTTTGAPVATTTPATLVTATTATMNGSAVPNGDTTYGYFRYGTTNPGTCSDSYGTRVQYYSYNDPSLGAGSSGVAFSQALTGLSPGTTYYFCAAARNGYGTVFGSVLSFTTDAALPSVNTNSASLLTGTTAQLNSTVNPGGAATTAWYRYATASPGSCNDTFGTRAPTSGGASAGSGNAWSSLNQAITGLTPGTTYYYCAVASNSKGTTFGSVVSFATPTPPTVTTVAASGVSNSSAYLNGSGIPNGSAATGYFRYSLSDPGTCDDAFGSRAPTVGGSSLGSGTTAQSFNQQLTGLSPATTYYFCAIANSAEGTAFGAVMSFTTATSPAVTTTAATLVTSSSATLNGSADPNGDTTYGYFRYSTSNPVVCNDSFGTRVQYYSYNDPSLGAGTTPVAFGQPITGLTPGMTYYYCALARNAYGTSFGAVLSFTATTTKPTVSTSGATSITTATATFNGSANPNGADTTGWFRYATASPGTCNDSFGTRTPATGGSPLGGGTTYSSYQTAVTGLTPGTTYYFCAIAQNSVGISFGSVLSFATTMTPAVNTFAATPVTSSAATLNASVNPNGYTTTGWFRYSSTNPGSCDDTFGTATATSSVGGGSSLVALIQPITGLSPATTYYFCAIAQSSIGTTFGALLSFTTPNAPPSANTLAATAITDVAATLNATGVANGAAATGWFRYATTNPGTCNDTFGTRAPTTGGTDLGSGNATVPFSANVTGLTASTTYFFCALATSGLGNSVGSVLSFTTAAAPSVTTVAATLVGSNTATLNGTGTANRSATTGWFRYSTTNPVTCNDTFGTRAPATLGADLGSGTTATAYSQALTGLTMATTYYYCAVAQNAVAKGYGAVMTFTTLTVPGVTTVAASGVSNTVATLNGSANPNGLAATGYFRYGLTDPGTCNDTFGTRAPVSSGTALGSGSTAVTYVQALTGLTAGTTYYYCAIANNSGGIGYGTVLSFTTTAIPVVTTSAATLVSSTGATLNGAADPMLAAATGYFRYATTNPVTCNDTFGTRAPLSGGAALGAGSADVPYTQALTGLAAATTYYYCAIANNAVGTGLGTVTSFTTLAAPVVATVAASAITGTTATINGTANPRLSATTGWFRYSTTSPGASCNDTFGTRIPLTGGTDLGSGSTALPYSQDLTGLTAGTTYYFCAIAQNAVTTAFGSPMSFVAPGTPVVTTVAASAVGSTAATLNGSANPRGAATSGWFRYSETDPGTCNDTFGTRLPGSGGSSLGAGTTASAWSQAATGLTPATTYYYCAIAQNSEGTQFGLVLSFTTLAGPTVTTAAATLVTGTSATVNGTANPNGATATGWFRYATTNPTTCNDTFGTRTPLSGGTNLGAGTTASPYSASLTALASGTTYYYCALASNSVGTAFGAVGTFTTPGAPSVTTVAASAIGGTGATLNGTANPSAAATTGWFRYSAVSPGACNDTFGTKAPAVGTDLGSGTTVQPYSQALTGLALGTTYYFCAIANNVNGTRFGALTTFTTLAAPTVTTAAATGISGSGATLNGSANPRGQAATGWFRFDTANPGTCDDAFGTRVPAAGGTDLGSGTSAQTYSEPLIGLAPGTTFYYCALAQNSAGTAWGSVQTFVTPNAPTAVTAAATLVSQTGATLNGSGNPRGAAATGYFRWSATDPGACDDTFGTRAPASGGTSLGSGTAAVAFAQALTGLSASTTYWYCAIATSTEGNSYGALLTLTTQGAPTVMTDPATLVTSTGATLNGTVNANGVSTTAWHRYATTNPGTCNNTFGTRAPTSGQTTIGTGTTPVSYSRALTGLLAGTTYYFCAVGNNVVGMSFGAVLSFTTPGAPSVTTVAASAVTGNGATLNGSANPAAGATSGWFRYATTNPVTCNDTFGTRTPAAGGADLGGGTAAVPYAQAVTGLNPGTTYWFCAIASNSSGTRFGSPISFATLATPTMTTQAASGVTGTDATFNGSGNPNGDAATGWFVYSDTDPGVCDDTFGIRVPATGGTDLGSGTTATAYSRAVTGLSPGTTYYYCAVGANSVGLGFGSVRSFSTAGAPLTTTAAATLVATTGATLNGTANPRGLATTGWFRYAPTDPGACDDTFGTRAPASAGSSLGSGTAAAGFNQALTGLTSGTTYYYCAIAQNAVGTSFGAVMSLRTLAAPSVTTLAATSVTGSGATLNGSASPNGATATGWFRYSTVSPGAACNDTFGTRSPLSGGTNLGAGAAAAPYAQTLTGLAAGTTYYFCALASNSAGTAFGTPLTFATPSAPVVTTVAASGITGQDATLNGTANPGGAATTGWFRYSATSPGASCNDTFGTRSPATGGYDLGGGSAATPFSQTVSGLTPGTTYYFCALAQNAVGTRFGAVTTFATQAGPTVTTLAATAVAKTGATLNGSANPNGLAATGWFRWAAASPGSCNDTFGTRTPATGGSDLGSGTAVQSFSEALTGLTAGTTYWYCAIAQTAVGKSLGALQSFVTPDLPQVRTNAATAIGGTVATVNGQATPKGAATTGWFRYSTTNPTTCDDLFGTRAPTSGGTNLGSGSASASFTATLTGLATGTTYYFCAIAQNSEGSDYGNVLAFTTLAAPEVVTAAATAVAGTSATLNGTGDPNGAAATGWFRYSTTSPGATCNDTFGTRAPASSGASLGSGTSPAPFSQALTGLTPGTTYHYCAIASNSVGTAFGSPLSFTTTAAAPVVTTAAPTLVTGTSATFNGSANPGGAAATGWFRYATVSPGTCNDTFGTREPASGGASLGSGTANAPFAQAVAGLVAGRTYFVCALAQNSAGTGVATVLAFTTPDLPLVTTKAATGVTGTAATLNGSANPNRADTTAWFRYDTTDPGTCDDTFGTRAPTSGGTSLAAGSAEADFSQDLTGLAPGTTYFFCAVAQNSQGTAFGAVQSLRTPGLPLVTTSSASNVSATAATLNGSAVPNGADATGYFRWATTQPAACDDTFGTRQPATGGTALGAGSSAASFSQAITGLAPGATVWFCAAAQSAVGTGFGAVLSFQVSAPVPIVETLTATDLEATAATLNGTVNPNGTAAIGWFRYTTTAPTAAGCSDTYGKRAPAQEGITVGGGTSVVPFSLVLTDLRPNTRYYFCAIGSNVGGAGFGGVRSFSTAAVPPTVTTQEASIDGTKANLQGLVNPNGADTTGWFQIDSVKPEKCDDAFGRKVPMEGVPLGDGVAEVPLWAELTDLTGDTTYWYCAVATSAAGTTYGEPVSVVVKSFDVAPQGCGCGATGGAAPASLGLALALLAVLGRRRSRPSGSV